MNTVDVLRKVKGQLTDPDRWCKGQGTTGPASCIGYAIDTEAWSALEGTSELRNETVRVLGVAIGLDHPTLLRLIDWNDAPGTTHADLIAALDRAILSLAPETQSETLETVSA